MTLVFCKLLEELELLIGASEVSPLLSLQRWSMVCMYVVDRHDNCFAFIPTLRESIPECMCIAS